MATRKLKPKDVESPAAAGLDDGTVLLDANFDIELELLLEAIFRKYQHDFRRY